MADKRNIAPVVLYYKARRFWLSIALLILSLPAVNAQRLAPEVINSGAFIYNAGDQYFDMSVGEIAITTIKEGQSVITQGFLQPISLFIPCTEFDLVYYPNPVINEVTIIATGCDLELDFVEAYDLFGKKVLSGGTIDNKIDLSTIGVGVYLLRAYTNERREIGTIKIVKTSI
jgi:hypothetical protein